MNIFIILSNLILTVLTFFVNFLPNADSNIIAFIDNGITNFRGYIDTANQYFPVNTFLLVFGFIVTIELALMIFGLVKFILANLTLGVFKK